jgi:hypothetical protein
MKIPTKTKSEVFNLRLDVETKKILESLAKQKKFNNSSSAVIRYLIHSAYDKKN